MELSEYWRILVRRGWIVALVALIAAGTAYTYSARQLPLYRATAMLTVVGVRPDWGLLNSVKESLRNYAVQINSTRMAQRVISEQKLDMSPDALRGKLTASPIPENLTIQLDVNDSDPELAILIANAVAHQFVIDIEQVNLEQRREDRVAVQLLEPAGNAAQIAPRPRINAVAGGLLGLVVGGFIVLALEVLDDTIKSRDDVRRYVGDVLVLGAIPPTEVSTR